MIYLELFFGFLKVGLFTFGGAYAAIPLIRETTLAYGWASEETLMDMIAIAESTPGPIMVNLATYIGFTRGGVPGAALATLAVALPAFAVMLAVSLILKRFLSAKPVQAAMRGLIPCVVGVILVTGAGMALHALLPAEAGALSWKPFAILAILAAIAFGTKPLLKRKLSPIALIAIAAALGIAFYGVG